MGLKSEDQQKVSSTLLITTSGPFWEGPNYVQQTHSFLFRIKILLEITKLTLHSPSSPFSLLTAITTTLSSHLPFSLLTSTTATSSLTNTTTTFSSISTPFDLYCRPKQHPSLLYLVDANTTTTPPPLSSRHQHISLSSKPLSH